jgi:hypothetical protein
MNRIIVLLLIGALLLVFLFKNQESFTFSNKILKAKNKDRFRYVYQENFMDPDDFTELLNHLKKYDNLLDNSAEHNSIVHRYNIKLVSPLIPKLISKYENKIRHVTKNYSIYLAINYPIEYRKYIPGSFMNKHRDTLVYKIPQYECVLTLSNTTDSVTDIEGVQIKAKPNSLIILKANGVEHQVTKVTKGERKFLKFIFTQTDEFI